MFGSGVSFSPQGSVFSTQLVDLYGQTLGSWARPIVMVAVLTTISSTLLTVVDGFSRAIERTVINLRSGASMGDGTGLGSVGRIYWSSITALAVLSVLVLVFFIGNLTTMVDFATIVSFLTAPVLGYLNLRCVTSPQMPVEHRPGKAMRVHSWVGLILLGGIGVVYLVSLLA